MTKKNLPTLYALLLVISALFAVARRQKTADVVSRRRSSVILQLKKWF